jgi:hypothetical protein
MRFAADSLWIAFLSGLLLLMVSCGASRCLWERATDARGLSKHRAGCHFYKKSSILASQRRHERAKEAVATHSTISTTSTHWQAGSSAGNRDLDSDLSKFVNTLHVSCPPDLACNISSCRLQRLGRPRPIAPCRSLEKQRPGSASRGSSEPNLTRSLADSQCCSPEILRYHGDVDAEMDSDINDGNGIDFEDCQVGSYFFRYRPSSITFLIVGLFQSKCVLADEFQDTWMTSSPQRRILITPMTMVRALLKIRPRSQLDPGFDVFS